MFRRRPNVATEPAKYYFIVNQKNKQKFYKKKQTNLFIVQFCSIWWIFMHRDLLFLVFFRI